MTEYIGWAVEFRAGPGGMAGIGFVGWPPDHNERGIRTAVFRTRKQARERIAMMSGYAKASYKPRVIRVRVRIERV